MATDRIKKVNSLLEHEISKVLQKEIMFPNGSLVTVMKVETTSNLIEAKVYVSCFPDNKASQALEILKKSAYDIQQEINKKLNMRPIPKIIFMIDKTESKAGKVEQLLNELKNKEK